MEIGTIQIIPVKEMGLIQKGDDLTGIILDRMGKQGVSVDENDVLLITSKVVSKAEGRMIPLSTVVPSRQARALAKVSGRDPRTCELIIKNSKHICGIVPTGRSGRAWAARMPEAFPVGQKAVEELFDKEPTMILSEVENGLIVTDAGIDSSNVEGTENAMLLPESINGACKRIRQEVKDRTGKTIAVLISDTDIRYQRFGSVDQAVGSWGIPTIATHFGQKDLYGKPKIGGVDCLADMLSNAAALVMGNTDQAIPVALVKGMKYDPVDRGMAAIQVPAGAVAQGVFFNVWCDLKLWLYNNLISV
ncbi:MAG: coenzyme F420-0:L-glutamate ligase [Candidatus Riflebacteria bacterium]|nr:coenzyme F420-0:L-glutamate ligase [Candidatus Riflebacteria bacterium]